MYEACEVCGIAHDPMKLCELRHLKAFYRGTLDNGPLVDEYEVGEVLPDDTD